MKGNINPTELDETTVEDEEISTHQETIPLPYLAGTRRLAVRWIDGALNMVTVQNKESYAKK